MASKGPISSKAAKMAQLAQARASKQQAKPTELDSTAPGLSVRAAKLSQLAEARAKKFAPPSTLESLQELLAE